MATLSFNGISYDVDHAVKGADYIHGYSADGTCVISIDGITDFNVVTYDGAYMSPDACADEQCNAVRYVNNQIVTADGREVPVTDAFIATYGVTTNAEIDAAYQAGKRVLCVSSDGIYYPLARRIAEIWHEFSLFTEGGKSVTLCCTSDYWHVADSVYIKRTGGTMTGPLTLAGDPTEVLHAATKQYVDNTRSFIAEYGVTSFSEIHAAYEAGKAVFCRYKAASGPVLTLPLSGKAEGYSFSMYRMDRLYTAQCDLSSSWTILNRAVILPYSKVELETSGVIIAHADTGKYGPTFAKMRNSALYPKGTVPADISTVVTSGGIVWEYE